MRDLKGVQDRSSAGTQVRSRWVQLRSLRDAHVLLILPCNAAACVGNYLHAEVYRQSGWNTWREADWLLRELRRAGRVAFAAVDSSILDTQPHDPRGAIVLETEMSRARNPEGEDWGAPSWRWFRPTRAGYWTHLEALTEALVKGVQRVEELGLSRVLALVNPRAYFLALAAAVERCRLLDRWLLFQPPAHPRHLIAAVRAVTPFVRVGAGGTILPGGVYPLPEHWPALREEAGCYTEAVPPPWEEWARIPPFSDVRHRWEALQTVASRFDQIR